MKVNILAILVSVFLFSFCSNEGKNENSKTSAMNTESTEQSQKSSESSVDKGIGPITQVTLGKIDQAMVAKGKEIFKAQCSACHKITKRVVGPALAGVTERRSPEWIMNMIMNPEEMVAKNEAAKQLLAEYLAPMANQNITKEEARALLEYFRTKTASSAD
jgi:cytochrome c